MTNELLAEITSAQVVNTLPYIYSLPKHSRDKMPDAETTKCQTSLARWNDDIHLHKNALITCFIGTENLS